MPLIPVILGWPSPKQAPSPSAFSSSNTHSFPQLPGQRDPVLASPLKAREQRKRTRDKKEKRGTKTQSRMFAVNCQLKIDQDWMLNIAEITGWVNGGEKRFHLQKADWHKISRACLVHNERPAYTSGLLSCHSPATRPPSGTNGFGSPYAFFRLLTSFGMITIIQP